MPSFSSTTSENSPLLPEVPVSEHGSFVNVSSLQTVTPSSKPTIALILASTRSSRQNPRVARLFSDALVKAGVNVNWIDPDDLELPWMTTVFRADKSPDARVATVSSALQSSDGIIIITPEYNRSIPAPLKNLIDYFYRDEYAKKPTGVVSYSAGALGGARVTEHLRSLFAELGSPVIPTAASIPSVFSSIDKKEATNDEIEAEKNPVTARAGEPGEYFFTNPGLHRFVAGFMDEMLWYTHALRAAQKE